MYIILVFKIVHTDLHSILLQANHHRNHNAVLEERRKKYGYQTRNHDYCGDYEKWSCMMMITQLFRARYEVSRLSRVLIALYCSYLCRAEDFSVRTDFHNLYVSGRREIAAGLRTWWSRGRAVDGLPSCYPGSNALVFTLTPSSPSPPHPNFQFHPLPASFPTPKTKPRQM